MWNSQYEKEMSLIRNRLHDSVVLSQNRINIPLTTPSSTTNLQKELPMTEDIVYNTTVAVKNAHFDTFASLIGNQFKHGGDKYSLEGFPDREATDVISSVFGGTSQFDWILGTMMKYLFRFKNFNREKDLLKIATYCYILWLKQGNHLRDSHDEDTGK